MDKEQLIKRKSLLEEQNFQLQHELKQLDHLMRLAGFSNGLETVKATAQELVKYHHEEDFPEDDYAA